MTRQPQHTRARGVRVPDDVWQAAQAEAAERDETVSAVIVRALRWYARERLAEWPDDL